MVYLQDEVVKYIFLKLTSMIIYRNVPRGQKGRSSPEERVTWGENLAPYGLGLRTHKQYQRQRLVQASPWKQVPEGQLLTLFSLVGVVAE